MREKPKKFKTFTGEKYEISLKLTIKSQNDVFAENLYQNTRKKCA